MQKRRSWLQGAMLLSAAGLMVRVLGALYRIPLARLLGAQGLGLYQMVFPYYAAALMLSGGGLTPALTRQVGAALASGDAARAGSAWRTARGWALGAGLGMTFVGWGAAPMLAAWVTEPAMVPLLRTASLGILPATLVGVHRGWHQGRGQMAPTAVTQLAEQSVRLVAGCLLAAHGSRVSLVAAVEGAVLGMVLSEWAAWGLMALWSKSCCSKAHGWDHHLLRMARPVMLAGCVMPLGMMADERLMALGLMRYGLSEAETQAAYGVFSGAVSTLIHMPSVVTLALSTALVPQLAQASGVERAHRMRQGMLACLTVGLPAAVMLGMLAAPLLQLLYGTSLAGEQMAWAVQLMRRMAPSVLLMALVQGMHGVLQGLGRMQRPLVAMLCGMGARLAYLAVRVPQDGVIAAADAAVLGSFVTMMVDAAALRGLGLRQIPRQQWIHPLTGAALMGLAMGAVIPWTPQPVACVVLAGGIGGCIYLAWMSLALGPWTGRNKGGDHDHGGGHGSRRPEVFDAAGRRGTVRPQRGAAHAASRRGGVS